MRLTAARMQEGQTRLIEQGTDGATVTNSTLTDSNIVVPIVANALYVYELYIAYTASSWTGSAGGFQWLWTPTSAIRDRHAHFLARNNTSEDNSTGGPYLNRAMSPTTAVVAGGAGSQFRSIFESGKMQDTVDRNVTLQYAVGTGTGSATIRSNSWVRVTRVQ